MRRSLIVISALVAAVAVTGCAQTRKIFTRDQLVATAPVCADTSLVVYFNEGSDRLTSQADRMIAATAKRYRTCEVTGVRVIGLADSTGSAVDNLSLSQRRAHAVEAALVKRGFPKASFEVSAGGELGATTRSGADVPVRRRAEVLLSIRPH